MARHRRSKQLIMIERNTIVGKVAEALKGDLAAGQWRDVLPGGRVLAARYNVSRPSCDAALRLLAEQGLLTGGGSRCRWQIVEGAGVQNVKRPVKTPGVLLWIADDAPEHNDFVTREVFGAVRELWESRGGIVKSVTLDMMRVRRPQSVLPRIFSRYCATRVIMHTPPAAVAKAAIATGLPVFQFGGELMGPDVDGVGVSTVRTLRKLIPELAAQGRKRILIVSPDGRYILRDTMIEFLREIGGAYVDDPASWVVGVQHQFPDAIRDLWRKILSEKRPDVVYCVDVAWLVTLYCVALEMGIRPGKDFEVITGDQRPIVAWLTPPPRVVSVPLSKFMKRITRWLDSPDHKPGGFEVLVGGD